jgi:uncharacterized membrane protein
MQHVHERSPQPDVATHLEVFTPFQWLGAGVNDFKSAPGLSLLYGTLFAAATAGIFLLAVNVPWYAIAYLTGLVVLGPFMASGLYAASRDMERGIAPSITGSVRLLMRRVSYLALFSLMLSLVMAAWIRISALIFAIKFNTLSPSIEAYTSLLTSSDGWITLSFFAGMGFLLVSVVFIVSAAAVPLILDRDADFISSMQTSYRAVMANPGAMTVWALTIVALTAVGIATAFIGLAIIFPVLGYATWHSYRALVKK